MSSAWSRFLPMTDLREWRAADLPRDLAASLAVTVVAVPQGVAYALIAGLPPAVGLYAATIPVIIGSLFRSSRHVVAGPTNALSILVGGAIAGLVAATGASAMEVALSLALFIGIFQLAAGLLRLGAVVDYISNPVVLGYITGAGVLIGVGQLPNITATPMASGHVLQRLASWVQGLSGADPLSIGIALGTAALMLILRRIDRRIPGAIIAMAVGVGASLLFGLEDLGVRVVSDIAPVPASLPPLTLPGLLAPQVLLPVALAGTVLSLVESSAVARAISAESGDRLDTNAEFAGQGLANIASSFFGGYPISGSLSRSSLNWQLGARSRLSGVFSGLLVLGILLVAGPVVDHTPIPSLAGLLLVIAADLVDKNQIKRTMKGGLGDTAAFVATMVGAWALDLDMAIYVGVLISIGLFLRRARLLTVRELAVDARDRLREAVSPIAPDDDELPELSQGFRVCPQLRILHVEGSLFFGAASELQHILDVAAAEPDLKVLAVRLKRCTGLDITAAEVLKTTARQLRKEGRTLILVGMRPPVVARMQAFGVDLAVGAENLFPTEPGWFVAMDHALERGLELIEPHQHDGDCPLRDYLALRQRQRQPTTVAG